MKFIIEIDDTEPVYPDSPWTAVVYQLFDDGRTGDLIADASGVGDSPESAVADLLDDLGRGLSILETIAWRKEVLS